MVFGSGSKFRIRRSNSKAAYLAVRREKELGITTFEGSYKLTMSPSGEAIDTRNTQETNIPLEMLKIKENSTENGVLDNRLLDPPDLIPKFNHLNKKSCSVQDIRENCRKSEYTRSQSMQERYRTLTSHHRMDQVQENRISNHNMRTIIEDNDEKRKSISQTNLLNDTRLWQMEKVLRNSFPEKLNIEEENEEEGENLITNITIARTDSDIVNANTITEITKQERKDNKTMKSLNDNKQSMKSLNETKELINSLNENTIKSLNDKKQSLKSLNETKELINSLNENTMKSLNDNKQSMNSLNDKLPSLQRVQSTQEKRLSRSDSMKSNDNEKIIKVERSKSLKLIERSTSFGRDDSMKIVQRIISNNNLDAETSDAASQTDLTDHTSSTLSEVDRRIIEEDIECDKLSRDLASQLSPSDKLHDLLAPALHRKKPTDYVAGLFSMDVTSRSRRRNRQPTNSSTSSGSSVASSTSSPEHSLVNGHGGESQTTNERIEPLPSSSPYFTTSESKAKLLTQFNDSMNITVQDSKEMQDKKEELMNRLGRKLEILREEQIALTDECLANEELGTSVANQVTKLARPHEASKYRLHVEEVAKITSLLLGLSGRLARAENALSGLASNHLERKIHESKRDKLQDQLKEAKQLKENIDKRSECVSNMLAKYLNSEDYEDYHHYIHMKAKLIVDAKEIADKISLGEEQLAALTETLSVL